MNSSPQLSLRECIALKLMPDIRFFDAGEGAEPVLALTPELASGLAELNPGGVILFRENLASVDQICELTRQIRRCLSPQVLIGVDQEGGRVTRLPREECTSFSGNMALAACSDGERLAQRVGSAQARELLALGINVNFVPSLDVNSNPDNPVIGVRSFGDDPDKVASLGGALLKGLQAVGVAGAIKHFPGHGDTSQDSHTELPSVTRSAADAAATDLAPFARVISEVAPAMVMTAHIQYPALDGSTLPGTDVVVPATLSRAMMTGLLRQQMGYQGVLITDALDMRAISAMMSPAEAVVACFRAGVDIALMPLLVRSAASFEGYENIIATVEGAVACGDLDEAELRASAERVSELQQQLAAHAGEADACHVACEAHRALEQQIAHSSLTLVTGALPTPAPDAVVHLLMPGPEVAIALEAALLAVAPSLTISWQSLEQFDLSRERECRARADLYLVGVSEPAKSAVAVGGAEDLPNLPDSGPTAVQRAMLAEAEAVSRVVVLLDSPYPAAGFSPQAEAVLASYDSATVGVGGQPGPAYLAIADVLFGAGEPRGILPVALPDTWAG